jgi:hypothetical protein
MLYFSHAPNTACDATATTPPHAKHSSGLLSLQKNSLNILGFLRRRPLPSLVKMDRSGFLPI